MSGLQRNNTTALPLNSALFGGHPDQLLAFMGLCGTEDITGKVWNIQTIEAHQHRRADLVTVSRLDDRRRGEIKEELVTRLTSMALELDQDRGQELQDYRERMVARLAGANDLTARLSLYQIDLMTCGNDDLPSMINTIYVGVRNSTFTNDGTTAFPDARVHLVASSSSLRHRGRLPAVVLRFEQDPELAESLANATAFPEGEAFASAAGMLTGTVLLDTFIAPLLGCASPRVWGFHAVRSIGIVIFTFGITLRGTSGDPVSPLDLLPKELGHEPDLGNSGAVVVDGFTADACESALDWWILRVNQLCAYVSDPVVFTDRNGQYSASSHFAWLLTFEQLFRRTSAVQTEVRNITARRTLAFGALDIIGDRIYDLSVEDLCRLKRAEKTLASLEASLPEKAAIILLPHARRAVDALRELQEGFFIARQRHKHTVDVVESDGTVKGLSPDAATAKFMAALRKSTHGFGPKPGKTDLTAILAHHTGEVPPDVYLLPYLYLLDMLANADRTKSSIIRKAASDSAE